MLVSGYCQDVRMLSRCQDGVMMMSGLCQEVSEDDNAKNVSGEYQVVVTGYYHVCGLCQDDVMMVSVSGHMG